MQTKDTITNKYSQLAQPTKYTDTVKNYVDLVNQPTAMDNIAEGFQKYGKLPAKNAYAELDNMTMEAIGDGMKAGETAKRQEKLAPILEQAGQINALAAMYEAQIQEDQIQQRNITEGFKLAAPAYSEWAKAKMAGDETNRQKLAKSVYDSIRSVIQDADMGEFSHEHDGVWYVKDNSTGENKGVNLYHWAMQNGVDFTKMFGADASFVAAASSAGAMNDYKNTQEMERLALDKGRADIDNTKAQTGLYGANAGKAMREANNPPMSEQQKLNYTANKEHMDGLQKFIKEKSIGTKIEVLNRLEKIFKQEESVGGTPVSAIQRWAKKQFGTDEKLQEAEILKKYFFPDIKGVAGNPNREEWTDLVTKIISTNQNPTAALDMIEFERNKAQEYLDEYEDTSSVLSTNPYQLHHHPDIRSQISLKGEERRKKQGAGNNQPKDKKVVEKLIQWD